MAKWDVDFKALARKQHKKLDTVVREATMALFGEINMRSPVDEGTFRGSWQVGFDEIPTGNPTVLDRDAYKQAGLDKPRKVTYYINNLPYAKKLENGHSKQAAAGWLDREIVNFAADIKRRANAAKSK